MLLRNTLVCSLVCGLLDTAGFAEEARLEETLPARWAAAYNGGDLEALAAMYDTNARLKQGYCPVVSGRQEIEAFWRGDMGDGSVTTELRVEDAFQAVDLLYVSGSYAVDYTDEADEPAQVGGTYLQIWRRHELGWSIFRETWTNLACAEIRVSPEGDEAAAAASTAGAAI